MTYFDYSQPLVDDQGYLTERGRYALTLVERYIPLLGEGTPEASVNAPQYSHYIDKNGSSGSILYIKMSAHIGNDTTKGWVAV